MQARNLRKLFSLLLVKESKKSEIAAKLCFFNVCASLCRAFAGRYCGCAFLNKVVPFLFQSTYKVYLAKLNNDYSIVSLLIE